MPAARCPAHGCGPVPFLAANDAQQLLLGRVEPHREESVFLDVGSHGRGVGACVYVSVGLDPTGKKACSSFVRMARVWVWVCTRTRTHITRVRAWVTMYTNAHHARTRVTMNTNAHHAHARASNHVHEHTSHARARVAMSTNTHHTRARASDNVHEDTSHACAH